MDETPVMHGRGSDDVGHVIPLAMGGALVGVRPLEPPLVSVKDAGVYLGGIVPREVYRLVDRKKLKGTKLGRRRMIVVESLKAYAQELIDQADESDVNADETAA